MNGIVQSVPITTLAGITTLTDFLPELPLPTPVLQTTTDKSLLFHPRVAHEAHLFISMKDDNLVPQLVTSLSQTTVEQIQLKEQFTNIEHQCLPLIEMHQELPELLKAILQTDPKLFEPKPGSGENLPMPQLNFGNLQQSHPCSDPNNYNQSVGSVQSNTKFYSDYNKSNLIEADKFLSDESSLSNSLMNKVSGHSMESSHQGNLFNVMLPMSQSGNMDPLDKASAYTQSQHSGYGANYPSGMLSQLPDNPLQDANLSAANYASPYDAWHMYQKDANTHYNAAEALKNFSPTNSSTLQHNLVGADNHKFGDLFQQDMRQSSNPEADMRQNIHAAYFPNQGSVPDMNMPNDYMSNNSMANKDAYLNKNILNPSTRENVGQLVDDSLPLPYQQHQDKLDSHREPHVMSQENTDSVQKNEINKVSSKELVVMLNRSLADQALMKKHLSSNDKSGGASEDTDRATSDWMNSNMGRRKRQLSTNNDGETRENYSPIKPKIRKFEKKFVPVLTKLSLEELIETNTYQRFNTLIETIFENTEESVLADIDEEEDVPSEFLISDHHLQTLCTETVKLKTLGAMESVPADRLIRLLNILEKNIRDGAKLTPLGDPDDDAEQNRMWTDVAMGRIQQAADASLICMHIMTSSNMPKTVYLEDVIERIIIFMKFQLQNTIYPSYDPVYRITKNKVETSHMSNRKKRNHIKEVREKNILVVYNKMHELVSLLAELLNIQILTDTSVLHASTLGIAPFFVENVSDLQLSALKLITVIFTKYEKHRKLLLNDILASIARLPSSKKSLRTYKLNNEDNIQMLTALILQLIQCVVILPDIANLENSNKSGASKGEGSKPNAQSTDNVDVDVLVLCKYDTATRLAGNFLTAFLKKCGNKGEEVDYRPLFENFVQDLLMTVNKPEWPAAELLLSLLGSLLVNHFSNKNSDMSLRVASIEYLGVIAARLRKNAVRSHCELSTIDQIVNDIKIEQKKDVDYEQVKDKEIPGLSEDEVRFMFLQKILLDYLAVNGTKDSALNYARNFYLAQWYRDCVLERSRVGQQKSSAPKKLYKKKGRKKGKIQESDEDDVISADNMSTDENDNTEKKQSETYHMLEEKKKFIISKIRPYSTGTKPDILQTYIDYNSAELISQYLASSRSFSKSFDKYLQQILRVLTESSIAIRTKAMKCLTMIVEADPTVLARIDMQLGVKHSFLDHSTSVREAAVDLVGKFVLSKPDLIDKYYDKLLMRILDTGVSVRKRVIKILKDICIEYPDYPKIPEICVKMLRRVNDEEGIRKLVMEVFQNMWFTPVKDHPTLDTKAVVQKVMNITDVVAACKDIGLEWFEQLLQTLFKPKEDNKEDTVKVQGEPSKVLLTACKQIVDCLIENVLRLEETNFGSGKTPTSGSSQRLVACLTTLYLFAKIRPQLLINHAITLQPYLSLKCQTQGDYQIISSVAHTLELVVPLMEHPSETFLAQLEEDSVKLILQHDRSVVASCLSCLGSIVNNVTKNYKLIRDCFSKYYGHLTDYKWHYERNPDNPWLKKYRPFFRRALFTVGLLLRHFDFTNIQVNEGLPCDIKDKVFETLFYFVNVDNDDTQKFTMSAIGSLCIRHFEFMLTSELKTLYHYLLTSEDASLQMKIQVLNNIELYLQEEESRMIKQDQEWAKLSKQENLKEMGDVSSGMASTVIQAYLREILESFLHANVGVRTAALKVIQLILTQGLVHPVQIVPYLICMSTDFEKTISHTADKQLQDIEKKYPGFIHMKAQSGIKLSYRLQKILQNDLPVIRGIRVTEGEYPAALNGFLYSILRNTKQQRRAIVNSFLKQFEESAKTTLSQMLYLADNLAYFAYQVQDEPLFIIHHIDIIISMSGTNLLQSFKELLYPSRVENSMQLGVTSDAENLGTYENIISSQNMLPGREDPSLLENNYMEMMAGNLPMNLDPNLCPTNPMCVPNMVKAQLPGSTLVEDEEDEEEDEENVLARLPEDTTRFEECVVASQGFLLLLTLRQHLKELYGLTDSKISQYSPSEAAKIYEKAVSRKSSIKFKPKSIMERLKEKVLMSESQTLNEEDRKRIVKEYLDFKQLMLKFDPDEVDEDDEKEEKVNVHNSSAELNRSTQEAGTSENLTAEHHDSSKYAQNEITYVSTVSSTKESSKIPKLTISTRQQYSDVDTNRKSRSHRAERPKKQKKKKKRKPINTSESDMDSSDPDFVA